MRDYLASLIAALAVAGGVYVFGGPLWAAYGFAHVVFIALRLQDRLGVLRK